MSTFSVDAYKLPDDYFLKDLNSEGTEKSETTFRTPEDWMKHCAERLNKLQKGIDNMTKDIKVGDTAKFEGTVKDIQYDQNGNPTGYTVVDWATSVGATIPALVADKVSKHPELPKGVDRIIRGNYRIYGSEDRTYITLNTEGISYANFLYNLVSILPADDYHWLEKHESDIYNAYKYGYTVAQDTTKYLYPVPHTDTELYFYPLERPITKYSNLSVATYDHDSIDTFEFTESELNILGVSLDDVQLAEKTEEE